MAITYQAGRRIQGLSQGTVTSSDDLTTDKGWTTSNGISGNGYNASDYVDFKLICPDSSSLAGGRVLVDLQHADYLNGSNLSNTAFTARIKINYSALDQASQNQNKSYIGFYSNDSWGGSTQDAFVLQLKLDYGQSSKKFYVEIMNDEVFEGSAHQTEFTSTTPATSTDYYIEFTKNSNVHTIRITTNSDYTGGETQSITYGGVENLRYFGCKARGDTQANGGNAQGTIKPDISIANDATSFPSSFDIKPSNVQAGSRFEETDTRKMYHYSDFPTYETDFSSDDWTGCKNDACDSGAPTTVTISGGDLSAVNVNVALDDRMVKALGTTLSNTTWVLQFETNVASTGTHSTLVGLVTTGGNMNNTSILCDYNASNKIIMREYNSGLTEMGSGISISTGTQYYVTVIRTSLTGLTLEVRTGSHTGTLVGSESGTITGATGLTYVQSGAYGRGSGTATYDIDNIKIYSGVTDPANMSNSWKEEGT